MDEQKKIENVFKVIQSSSKIYEKGWPSAKKYDSQDHTSVRSTPEMLHCLDRNPGIVLDARVLHTSPNGLVTRKMGRDPFREAYARDVGAKLMREGSVFASDSQQGNGVGNDFTPLLGGAFYKNLYYWGGTGESYIQMHSDAFYAYHHDPIARALIEITRNFVLGNGFDVQTNMNDKYGMAAMIAWKAFEEANDLQEQMSSAVIEQGVYGENMWWWLPNQQTKISYRDTYPGEVRSPTGIVPRIRLMDPSMYVEIVTYPEDISRKLFYVTLVPTQFQIYSSNDGIPGTDGFLDPSIKSMVQPTLKFIYQQTPSDQILHAKINGVSNEKRGRSDLYPIFGYLKRLRDMVEYGMISMEKNAAWAIDTTVKGDITDIQSYMASQAQLGTVPPAGSEFVHSEGIIREYRGNGSATGQTSDILSWGLSLCCAGVGIPVNYLATHLSGGSTKASAIVATEPVAKKMEHRRNQTERTLKKMWDKVMATAGLPNVDCDFIFPEILTQDRSQKLKDLLLMQQSRWITPKRAASIAAKEMHIDDYDYNSEVAEMKDQLPEVPMPLVDPGKLKPTGQLNPGVDTSGLSSADRSEVHKNDSTL